MSLTKSYSLDELEEAVEKTAEKMTKKLLNQLREDKFRNDFLKDLPTKQDLENLQKKIENLELSLEFSQGEILDLRKQNSEFAQKIKYLEEKIKSFDILIKNFKKSEKAYELKERKFGIVVYGVPEFKPSRPGHVAPQEVLMNSVSKITETTGLSIDVGLLREGFRLGKPREGSGNPRPMKLRFISIVEKQKFMSEYLEKRQEFMEMGVRIRDDLPEETRQFRKGAYKYLNMLYEGGHRVRFVDEGMQLTEGGRRKIFNTIESLKAFCDSIPKIDNGVG